MSTFYVQTLGCAKNQVDSEKLTNSLSSVGLTEVENIKLADVVLLNTCGFILDARRESVEMIFELLQQKPAKSLLLVFGCLVTRYQKELSSEIPEALFFSLKQVKEIPKYLQQNLDGLTVKNAGEPSSSGLIGKKLNYRYLKIAEGCSNYCSYCAIPMIRGGFVSRLRSELIDEAAQYIRAGAVELNLIAQDPLRYGQDLPQAEDEFFYLLDELEQLTDLSWIRLLYLHPGRLSRRLLERIAASGKILPYFDLPFQHVNKQILAAMNRDWAPSPYETIELVRSIIPDSVIRSTFIIGFPGETKRKFNELLRFLESSRLERAGFFAFSAEEGTAAETFRSRPRLSTTAARLDQIFNLQLEIMADINQQLLGQEFQVLIDGDNPEGSSYLTGRTWRDAPDVDSRFYLTDLPLNSVNEVPVFINARVEGADYYDLYGNTVD